MLDVDHTFLGKVLGRFGDLIQTFLLIGLFLVGIYFIFSLIGALLKSLEHILRNRIRKLQGRPSINEEENDRYQNSLKNRDLSNKQRLLEEYANYINAGRYVIYSDRGAFNHVYTCKNALDVKDVLKRVENGEFKELNLRDIDTISYHQV